MRPAREHGTPFCPRPKSAERLDKLARAGSDCLRSQALFPIMPPLLQPDKNHIQTRRVRCQAAVWCKQILKNLIVAREFQINGSQRKAVRPEVERLGERLRCEVGGYCKHKLVSAPRRWLHRHFFRCENHANNSESPSLQP